MLLLHAPCHVQLKDMAEAQLQLDNNLRTLSGYKIFVLEWLVGQFASLKQCHVIKRKEERIKLYDMSTCTYSLLANINGILVLTKTYFISHFSLVRVVNSRTACLRCTRLVLEVSGLCISPHWPSLHLRQHLSCDTLLSLAFSLYHMLWNTGKVTEDSVSDRVVDACVFHQYTTAQHG